MDYFKIIKGQHTEEAQNKKLISHKTLEIKVFKKVICLLMKGPGSIQMVSDPGSGRLKNIGIRILKISVNFFKGPSYLKRLQSSEPLHTKMNPFSFCSDHGLYRILSSYLLAHIFLLKKSAKGLLYFGLDCGMLEIFKYSTHEQ
jgi:hypothetical protein